jgi:acetyl esterase/lipase
LICNGIALTVAATACFVELWTIVPAPTLPLLLFAVLVPEIAPFGTLVSLLSLAVSLTWATGRVRVATLVLSGTALFCALLPPAQLPATIAACDAAMDAAFPDAFASGRRFSLARAFFGERPDATVRLERGIPFVTRDGARLALDLYRPPGAWPHPAVVVIYGGGWRSGTRNSMADDDRKLAALGYTVVAVEYRLVPRFRFPTQAHDVEDALSAIARNARAWGIDPKRVALLGRSAGGQLALSAAYRSEAVTIRSVVAYYAPVDLARGYLEPPVPDPADVRRLVRDYLDATPQQAPQRYRLASPLDLVRPGLPPTLLLGGRRDQLVLIRFQRALRDALEAHGDTVVSLEFPWSNHAFDSVPEGLGGQLASSYVDEFLGATL